VYRLVDYQMSFVQYFILSNLNFRLLLTYYNQPDRKNRESKSQLHLNIPKGKSKIYQDPFTA